VYVLCKTAHRCYDVCVYQSVDNEDISGGGGGGGVCFSCSQPITERHLLKVRGFHRPWHVRCLRCSVCQLPLDRESTCFYRGRNIYCRTDYIGYRSPQFSSVQYDKFSGSMA